MNHTWSFRQRLMAFCAKRPVLRVETLALLLSVWFTTACNPLFWGAALAGRELLDAGVLGYAAALAMMLSATHFVLLTLLATLLPRPFVRPGLALVAIAAGLAAYYMRKFHIYLDADMIRNVLNTDAREAAELFSWRMIPAMLTWVVPPLVLIARIRLRPPATGRAFLRAGGLRLGTLVLGFAAALLAALTGYQDLSALMRNHKEARYLITPANLIYGLALNVSGFGAVQAASPLIAVGEDAVFPDVRKADKPVMVLVVVGETARAANWGLSGYSRPTTPRLASLDVINFADVTACGTSTEVSLPCMLSPYGRRKYDEDQIRQSESLPHVVAHAGLRTAWLDNQSGCKGACDGLEVWKPAPADCKEGVCLDEALLAGARRLTEGRMDDTVLFLHMLGNHGPAYFRRYPEQMAEFQPACQSKDLAQCSREEIVNAYDNALRYTDHVLAEAIEWLKQMQATHDTALVYVSDHGESLGENGLYLHGLPYAIGPDVQKKVPMLMWLSGGYAERFALDADCLRARAAQPTTHDSVFHTVLGLLDLRTAARAPDLDLAGECRRG